MTIVWNKCSFSFQKVEETLSKKPCEINIHFLTFTNLKQHYYSDLLMQQ